MTSVDQLSAWVAEYDGQGWHRTGTRTDDVSAHWLSGAAGELGAATTLTAFPLSRLVHRGSSVLIDGVAAPAMPLFDCGLPGPEGVAGRLGPLGSAAEIGVTEYASGAEALELARLDGGHRAIVVIGAQDSGGLALLNAPHAEQPYGPPVIQVADREGGKIRIAAKRRLNATVRIDASRRPGSALNVVSSLDAGSAVRVMVLTPRSGWWHCAAERGGGIAAWLSAIDALSQAGAPERRLVRFVATSGHELGFVGLRQYLAAEVPPAGAVWVHLGANLGSRGGELRVAASDAALRSLALAALAARADAPAARPSPVAVGEASQLHAAGQRYVSLVGSNAEFHRRSDRYPGNVDLPALAAVSGAIASIVDLLLR